MPLRINSGSLARAAGNPPDQGSYPLSIKGHFL